MLKQVKQYLVDNFGLPANATDETAKVLLQDKLTTGEITADKFAELTDAEGHSTEVKIKSWIREAINDPQGPSYSDIVAGAGDDGASSDGSNIRVKKPSERYLTTKSIGKHKITGEPVVWEGRTVYTPSEAELAKVGVFFKHFQRSNAQTLGRWGMPVPSLTDHEEQLLAEIYHTSRFCGVKSDGSWSNGQTLKALNLDTKSLLNDATSGGSNLVPFEFDNAVIQYPLLHSELFPFVDLKSTNRDEVQTAAISNVTVVWNVNEGSEIPLFDTDALVANITASVHPVSTAVEYGRDLESDSPVNLGAILTEITGEVMSQELDGVIANGSGTTQPEGIFTASGTTTVNSSNGSTGPPTIDDYESLLFGLGKQYRRSDWNPRFIANDTSYQRARGIPVDSSSDARRVFGMSHEDYRLLNRGYSVQNDIGNAKVAFCALKKYRMWRRSGLELFFTNEGKELARRNLNLLVARGRYAGLLVDSNAAVVMTDAQS